MRSFLPRRDKSKYFLIVVGFLLVPAPIHKSSFAFYPSCIKKILLFMPNQKKTSNFAPCLRKAQSMLIYDKETYMLTTMCVRNERHGTGNS